MDERKESGGESKLAAFRRRVQQEFGRNLEKATPANVRDFMDNYQEDMMPDNVRGRIELNESKTTYEEILKDFFARILDRPTEEALILLWLMAFEMSFYTIEQHVSDRFQTLFGDLNDDNGC
jgi:hypothetical protein